METKELLNIILRSGKFKAEIKGNYDEITIRKTDTTKDIDLEIKSGVKCNASFIKIFDKPNKRELLMGSVAIDLSYIRSIMMYTDKIELKTSSIYSI